MNRKKMLETLEAISSIHTKSGLLPTVKELREELALRSNSPVVIRLKYLKAMGLVNKKKGIRTISITNEGEKLLSNYQGQPIYVGNETSSRQSPPSLQFQTSGTFNQFQLKGQQNNDE